MRPPRGGAHRGDRDRSGHSLHPSGSRFRQALVVVEIGAARLLGGEPAKDARSRRQRKPWCPFRPSQKLPDCRIRIRAPPLQETGMAAGKEQTNGGRSRSVVSRGRGPGLKLLMTREKAPRRPNTMPTNAVAQFRLALTNVWKSSVEPMITFSVKRTRGHSSSDPGQPTAATPGQPGSELAVDLVGLADQHQGQGDGKPTTDHGSQPRLLRNIGERGESMVSGTLGRFLGHGDPLLPNAFSHA